MKDRKELDSKYKWKLEDIYPDNDAWEKDFELSLKMADKINAFQNTLAQSPKSMFEGLQSRDEILKVLEKLYTYARMRRDEDNAENVYQALTDRASGLLTKIYAGISFFDPEIIEAGEGKIESYMSEYEPLRLYSKYFENLLRQKDHILTRFPVL